MSMQKLARFCFMFHYCYLCSLVKCLRFLFLSTTESFLYYLSNLKTYDVEPAN